MTTTVVDPKNYINTNRTTKEMQETLVWQMLVAGKNADQMAAKHQQFLNAIYTHSGAATPFEGFKILGPQKLRIVMYDCKLGKYDMLGAGFSKLAASDLDLATCSLEDLEDIPGIGPKTSRFFMMGNRAGVKLAILDTHILRFMRQELGMNTPKSTPTRKAYMLLERQWLAHCESIGVTDIAQYDLSIWKKYSGRDN